MDLEAEYTIPPKIKAIHDYINNELIGLSKMKKIHINLIESSTTKNSYYYELEIPFAGTYLRWEVIFSNEDLSFAPDFDFPNDQFLADPDINVIEESIPSMSNWDIDDSKSLYNTVSEFLALYKKYQIDRLQVNKYSREYMEYSQLINELNIPEDDIEVYIDNLECIHFLIQLPVDVSILPPYMGKYFESSAEIGSPTDICNPGSDTILLRMSFMNQKVQSGIWLNHHLEEVIGASKQLQLPACNKDTRLLEYVPAVKAAIKEKMQIINRNYKWRNHFVSTMLAYQSGSIIEYDNVSFSKMTLFLEANDNSCLVVITLSNQFVKPMVQLRSLFCEKNSKPMSESLNYSYNHDGSVDLTVKKILNTVHCYLTTYKAESNHSNNKNDFKPSEKFSFAAALNKKDP